MIRRLKLELAGRGIAVCTARPQGPASEPLATLALAPSESGERSIRLDIEVRDAVTAKRVGREIDLSSVPADGRPDVVALAADELLRASWAELALPRAPPPAVPLDPALRDRLTPKAARATGLPFFVSFIPRSEREIYGGESLEEGARVVDALGPDAILVNCVPAETAERCLDTLARATRRPIGCYPNAGHPDFDRGTWRPDQPLKIFMIGSDFEVRVWETLLRLPLGKATTYSDIAAHIGRPAAARAVGAAVGKNPISFVVPCHRVLGKGGSLCGYHWGLTRKRAILGWEAGVVGQE